MKRSSRTRQLRPKLRPELRPTVPGTTARASTPGEIERPRLPVLAMTIARAAIPLWGVFVQDWSATRQLLLYWVDAGVSLAGAFAVVLLRFMPRPESPAETLNTLGGALLGGMFLAAFVLPVLGIPLLLHAPLAEMLALLHSDPAFTKALIAHAAGTGVMMLWVYWDRDVCAREASQARDRFTFAFVRWMAVYLVLISPLASASGWAARIAVILYVALGAWLEIAPRHLHACIDRLVAPGR